MSAHTRREHRRLRAPVLLGILAALVLCSACLAHHKPRKAAPVNANPKPSWASFDFKVKGCALGHSGPTVNPGDSMRNAMEVARQELAAQKLKARIVDFNDINTKDATEYNFQEIEGMLENTAIVASHTDGRPDDPHFLTRESYALACMQGQEARVSGGLNKAVPEWVRTYHPPANGEVCVLGISGPTMNSWDQEKYALRNGAEALVRMRSVHVYSAMSTEGDQVMAWNHAEEIGDGAIEAQLAGAKIKEKWADTKGQGPYRLPGVLYTLVCAAP